MHRFLLLAAMVTLTSGCSAVKLLYGQADILIESWADKYVELDDAQEDIAYRNVDRWLAWHRTAMLPRYAEFMRGVARNHHRGNYDRARFDRAALEVRHLMEDTARGSFPLMAEVLVTLTPTQINSFHRKLEERADEAREKWAKPSPEVIEDGIDRFESMLEMFVGDLTEAQERDLRARALPLYDREPLWIDNRRRRNAAVVGFLRNGPNQGEIQEFLEPWLLRPYEFSAAGYTDYAEGFRRDIEGIVFEVFASLTVEQRATLIESMNSYADDLADLATSS